MSKAENAGKTRTYLPIVAAVTSIVLIVILGYLTFIVFVVTLLPNAGALSLVFLAVLAGVAAFFNPCAFPLLPVYLAYYRSVRAEREEGKAGALYGTFLASLGLITFNVILGLVIGTLGTAFGQSLSLSSGQPNLFVKIFRGIVGLVLVILGASHSTGRGISFGFLEAVGQRFRFAGFASSPKGLYLYGFGYNALGIGCGGPILAGLSIFALTYGGFASALLAFLIYSVVMAALIVFVSFLSGLGKSSSMKKLSASTGSIQKLSGLAQIAVGLFLIYSSVYTDVFVKLFFPKP